MSSYENVNIYVRDLNVPSAPIEGVVVRLLDPTTLALYGQGTTDADGLAAFLLPAPLTYQVRLYKFSCALANPNYIEVVEDGVNGFTLFGEPFQHPQAVDPRLCLASGFIRTPSGGKARNVDMHFIARFDPALLEGAAVLTERVTTRSDDQGYIELSLIRFAQYDVMIEGAENLLLHVCVPDQPWVNLPDLLFPRVKAVEFDPEVVDSTITIASGDELVYDVRVGTTDRRWLDDLTSDVLWSVGDSAVAAITLTATTITIRGLTAGSTVLTAARKDLSIVTIPDTAITGVPINITVT